MVESLGEDEMVVLPGAEGVSLDPLDGVEPKAHLLLESFARFPRLAHGVFPQMRG